MEGLGGVRACLSMMCEPLILVRGAVAGELKLALEVAKSPTPDEKEND
jgi:hypothetical protein